MPTLDERIEAARNLDGYTPGPWRVGIDDDGNPLSGRPGVFSSDELDCGIVHWDGFVQEYWRSARGDKEIHDNARLIAAAPDLHRLALDLAAERERLRGFLTYCRVERLRHLIPPFLRNGGHPVMRQWGTRPCADRVELVPRIPEQAAQPWPSPAARAALASEPLA